MIRKKAGVPVNGTEGCPCFNSRLDLSEGGNY